MLGVLEWSEGVKTLGCDVCVNVCVCVWCV
jgi:hypothetical protein